jgi:hypothetical protein
MIGKLIGAAVGRGIDRRDGKGGLKGAAFGMIAASVLRRAGPIGLAIGGAFVAKQAYDQRKRSREPRP